MWRAETIEGFESKLNKFDKIRKRIIFLLSCTSGRFTKRAAGELHRWIRVKIIESQLYLPLMRSLLGSCVDGRLKIHFNRSEFFNGFAKRCTFTKQPLNSSNSGGGVGVGGGGSSSSSSSVVAVKCSRCTWFPFETLFTSDEFYHLNYEPMPVLLTTWQKVHVHIHKIYIVPSNSAQPSQYA
ncbi:Signal recognition particle protein [Trichinella spiralis]|uniref:Signal recognition particle protein n=1 Tax=Trichinella spiralis TaxID=6334 RepID=A0ABR3KPP2_TRISP